MNTKKDCKNTEQGRETPVPVEVPGEGTGPARPSASDCTVPMVGNQAGVQVNASGTEEDYEKKLLEEFGKRVTRIGRSPTRLKPIQTKRPEEVDLTSETDPSVSEDEDSGSKRKRKEETVKVDIKKMLLEGINLKLNAKEKTKIGIEDYIAPKTPIKPGGRDNPIAITLARELQEMVKQIKELSKAVKEQNNTHRKIKEIARKLESSANRIDNPQTSSWLEDHKSNKTTEYAGSKIRET